MRLGFLLFFLLVVQAFADETEISFRLNLSSHEVSAGFNIGVTHNDRGDVHYRGIYHKVESSATRTNAYILWYYPFIDGTSHQFMSATKLNYYTGKTGDKSLDSKNDERLCFF